MVDVTDKAVTKRIAVAEGEIRLRPETLRLIANKAIPKGDAFGVARIAGISAAKKTGELIPLCHPLPITHVDIDFHIDEAKGHVRIRSKVSVEAKTGIEMEALTAVSVAALTIYDMCKAVDKTMVISDIRLIEKKGGKSGSA
ncbi:MAG: cyclic pyranopterin monophosphate synthase MoaC [Gemmatimonadota bacterium]|nr:MAG: cyclic pyranopterin monophosphate synthase MoaC [Gemmatimonadota bacterium]